MLTEAEFDRIDFAIGRMPFTAPSCGGGSRFVSVDRVRALLRDFVDEPAAAEAAAGEELACGTCEWFQLGDGAAWGEGECRRRSPVRTDKGLAYFRTGRAGWPLVTVYDQCRKYKQKAKEVT